MTQVRYRPIAADAPAWRIAVEGTALAVLSPEVTDQTAEAVWRRVGDGGIGAVLEALTGAFGTSLTAIPPFALAVVERDGVRVAVRGPVEIIVDDADGTQAVSGEGVATWTERFLPAAHRLTVLVGAASPDGADLPIRSGVVAASAVTVTLDAAAAVAPPASAAPRPPAVPASPPVTPASAPAVPASAPATAASAPAVPASPPAILTSAPAIPTPPAKDAEEMTDAEEPIPAIPSSEGDISSESSAPAVEAGPNREAPIVTEVPASVSADTWMPAATEAPVIEVPDGEYDLLWGETVARPITAAAVVIPEEPDAAPAPEASAPAPVEPLGDHDGETVAVADMRAMRTAERETFESTDGVPGRRPARGRIVLSTGRVVELERPVVIGRRPKSTRTSGAELPTLVAVDSPEQDISRSHVEIRAEGEHVLVTDLDTTNGTLLLRVGQDPVKLHPNEPTMVVAGDVLDIGDDVTVTFEEIL